MWKPEQKFYQYCQRAGHRSQEIVAHAQDNHPCDAGLKGGCPDAEPCTHGDAQDGHFFTAVVIKCPEIQALAFGNFQNLLIGVSPPPI